MPGYRPFMSTTREVVTSFLERLGAGEHEGVAALFAEDVDWRLDWPAGPHPAVPWVRPRSRRDEVAAHFREIEAHHSPGGGASVSAILVDGADAVVLAEIQQTAASTGRSYTAMCALRFTVEDGRITRYHVYEDSLAVARAFEASP